MASNVSALTCPSVHDTLFDCGLFHLCNCPNLVADPDIAGVGVECTFWTSSNLDKVLSAFVTTTGITLLLATAGMVLNILGDEDLKSNPIDWWLQRMGRRLFAPSSKAWGVELIKTWVLGYSDQQLVSGIALLLVVLIRLPASHGQISVYHVTIAVDCAWLSSNTYLASLIILRKDYFKTSLVVRCIRAFGTLFMFVLMVFTAVIQGNQYWGRDTFNCPAECLMKPLHIGRNPAQWMFADIFILVLSYSALLISMFKTTEDGFRWLVNCVAKSYLEMSKHDRLRASLPQILACPTFCILWCLERLLWLIYVFGSSYLVEIIGGLAWFGANIFFLQQDRAEGERWIGNRDENVWGFGQLFPCFILVLPFLTSIEAYCSSSLLVER